MNKASQPRSFQVDEQFFFDFGMLFLYHILSVNQKWRNK